MTFDVRKIAGLYAVPIEMLIDMGYPPPDGWWELELAKRIRERSLTRRLSVRAYGARWLLASIPRRAAHVRGALLDRPCCEEDRSCRS